MKKIFQTSIVMLLIGLCSCSDNLDTFPTDSVSNTLIFESADAAQVAVNGIYRAMYREGDLWSTSWYPENPGIATTTLVKDLHGEDHLMANQGNGWFFFDYAFGVDGDFSSTSGRQYSQWKMFYTFIAQTNYILAAKEQLEGYGEDGLYVLAQAHAIRAFSYTCLYEWYCQGFYRENSQTPGVPIYTEPTNTQTEGKPRGTVENVFTLINDDFQKAVKLFEDAGIEQKFPSHIDMYAAYGLWARAALIQEDWDNVEKYCNAALGKAGLSRVVPVSEMVGMNSAKYPNVLWGFEVIADQTGPYDFYFSHMDPDGGYGNAAAQCIDYWLYKEIPETDERKTAWWLDGTDDHGYDPYVQIKLRYAEPATFLADIIYLRAEELILMAAEAACMRNNYSMARSLLSELGNSRDTNYAARLSQRTDSQNYNLDTHGLLNTVRDEILFQRRVELWSEGLGRAFDLRRLNLGYNRDYPGSNHTVPLTRTAGDPGFVTLIPQRELDSNNSLSLADQNPR